MINRISVRNTRKIAETITALQMAFGPVVEHKKTVLVLYTFNGDGDTIADILRDNGGRVVSNRALA